MERKNKKEKIQDIKQKNKYDFLQYETIILFGDNIYTDKAIY